MFFEKRLLPREPSPRPVFRQVHPFTARAVTIYLAVGLVDVTFPYLLPLLRLFRRMSYHSDVVASLGPSVAAALVSLRTSAGGFRGDWCGFFLLGESAVVILC